MAAPLHEEISAISSTCFEDLPLRGRPASSPQPSAGPSRSVRELCSSTASSPLAPLRTSAPPRWRTSWSRGALRPNPTGLAARFGRKRRFERGQQAVPHRASQPATTRQSWPRLATIKISIVNCQRTTDLTAQQQCADQKSSRLHRSPARCWRPARRRETLRRRELREGTGVQ